MMAETRAFRWLRFTLLGLSSMAFAAQPAFAGGGKMLGAIGGLSGPPGAQSLVGWACESGNPAAAAVLVFTGGAPGVGRLYSPYAANLASGAAAIDSACGSGTGHVFEIAMAGDLLSRAGEGIFVYAVAPDGASGLLLAGSGHFAVPAATTLGSLVSLDAAGHATGWAFDRADSSASVEVVAFADGDALMGAETGTPVWRGVANLAQPIVDRTFGIGGNHGFSVQLPAAVTQGIHRLSFYAVDARGMVAAPLQQSPAVPGSGTLLSQVAFSTSATGFPTHWAGYKLPPGPVDFVGLSGTVTLRNTADIFSEMLFYVTFKPAGDCAAQGTVPSNGPPGLEPNLWSDIVKAPAAGTFTVPVNFTLPVGVPVSNCLVVAINGGTVAAEHEVTGIADLVFTFTPFDNAPTQMLGLDNEFCFGQNFGCEAATTDDSLSFAGVTQIAQRSKLNAIWGNIGDSPFDGSPIFGPLPTGPWTGANDVYLYRGAECRQFAPGRSLNGPGDFYGQIPSDAIHLVSAPLSGGGGAWPGETIDPLLAGTTAGITVYQSFPGLTLYPGDCLVELFGVRNTDGAFDNEDQLRAFVTPF